VFAFIEAAGWPVWPLVLASVISLAIIGERAWSLRSNVVVPPDLLPKVVQEFRQNGVDPMMLARLSIGAVATLAAGWVTAALAPRPLLVRVIPGIILLAVFIPQHIALWHTFPIWYHLTFLLSLVPLTYLGGLQGLQKASAALRG